VHASFLRKRRGLTGFYQFVFELRMLADTIFAAFHVDQLPLNAAAAGGGREAPESSGTLPLKPARFDCSMIRVSALNEMRPTRKMIRGRS
jgi:hypothetical protein